MVSVQKGDSGGRGHKRVDLELFQWVVFVVVKPPRDDLKQVSTQWGGGAGCAAAL